MHEDSVEAFEVRLLLDDGRKIPLRVPLEHEKIRTAHSKAFKSAFRKADSMIKEAAVMSNQSARVFVTG